MRSLYRISDTIGHRNKEETPMSHRTHWEMVLVVLLLVRLMAAACGLG
jgi:hypothetical protein